MNILETTLSGVVIIEPKAFADSRGYFFESYHAARYPTPTFVQDNVSRSTRGVLRGLHYQREHTQGKLVFVTRGAVFDVVVDVRFGSPTFGQAIWVELSEDNHRQIYIPPGFAHGFCVTTDVADFIYKCTDYYHPASEMGVLWNDPALNIPWPIANPKLSPKDEVYPRLKDLTPEQLLVYHP